MSSTVGLRVVINVTDGSINALIFNDKRGTIIREFIADDMAQYVIELDKPIGSGQYKPQRTEVTLCNGEFDVIKEVDND